jgi:hypothetical protein
MTEKDAPGKHALVVGGIPILTVNLQDQARIDNKALKDLYPKIAEECSKTSSHFVFRLPKRK